jgi:hypothetical protein
LRNQRWSVTDACAYSLCQEDIETGQQAVERRVADLRVYALKWLLRWQKVKLGSVGASVGCTLWSIWHCYVVGIANSWPQIGATAVFWCPSAWLKNTPSFLQQLPIQWHQRAPFNDPKLQPLRTHLLALADSRQGLATNDGTLINREILRSAWALLFLTTDPELHALPVIADGRADLVRYPGGLFVERSDTSSGKSARRGSVDMVVNLDQRTYHTAVSHQVCPSSEHLALMAA